MAITLSDITTDLRTRYDLGSTEKTAKLNQYIEETIRDISNELGGALTLRSANFTVTVDQTIVLPDSVDQVLLAYFNSNEIPVLDLSGLTSWQELGFYSDYALALKLDETTGNFILTSNGLSAGASVTLVYTVRVSDIDHIPATFRDVLFYGVAYKYEKYELRLLPQEYKVTFNDFDRRLTMLRGKQFNQMQLTKRNGAPGIVERLKEVL